MVITLVTSQLEGSKHNACAGWKRHHVIDFLIPQRIPAFNLCLVKRRVLRYVSDGQASICRYKS